MLLFSNFGQMFLTQNSTLYFHKLNLNVFLHKVPEHYHTQERPKARQVWTNTCFHVNLVTSLNQVGQKINEHQVVDTKR